MKTTQIMKREFLGREVRQDHKTGFFCVNDLTSIANSKRKSLGMPEARWDRYLRTDKTKEFLKTVMDSEEIVDIIKATRGRGSSTWVHPLVFFDYAMWLSPEFKVAVYKWLYDNLTVFRDDSGDSYKEMVSVLAKTQRYSPSDCGVIIPKLARAIKRDIGVEEWNKATPEQLKKRDEIHKSMILALKMGVDPERAYKTIKDSLV